VRDGAGDSKAGGGYAMPAGRGGAARGEHKTGDAAHGPHAVPAGRVGRAHGLDGSFYVTGARPRLLALGTAVILAGRITTVVRRAGTDEHPIVRLEGIGDREAVESLRGTELAVELAAAPELDVGEWWAQELEGCEVVDGERHVGTVVGLMELPSCEALEVRLDPAAAGGHRSVAASSELLVPMVRDAIRQVDPLRRRIDVDMGFIGES
jgi:16S rRNA processing protein RimM